MGTHRRQGQKSAYDQNALDTQLKSAVKAIVRKQIEAGIDIPSDGEQSKVSFTNYVRKRLSSPWQKPVGRQNSIGSQQGRRSS